MADVASSHNLPPLHHPASGPPTASDSTVKFDELLRLCETKAAPEAEAQNVVDRLDQVGSDLSCIGELIANIGRNQISNGKLDPSQKKRYLLSLMKICKAYSLVPTSYLISDAELEKLGEQPFDEVYNVWAGGYKKAGQAPDQEAEDVAIKILSRYETGQETVKKVGLSSSLWRGWSLTRGLITPSVCVAKP